MQKDRFELNSIQTGEFPEIFRFTYKTEFRWYLGLHYIGLTVLENQIQCVTSRRKMNRPKFPTWIPLRVATSRYILVKLKLKADVFVGLAAKCAAIWKLENQNKIFRNSGHTFWSEKRTRSRRQPIPRNLWGRRTRGRDFSLTSVRRVWEFPKQILRTSREQWVSATSRFQMTTMMMTLMMF